METKYCNTLISSREDQKLAYTDNIYDKNIRKLQSDINQDVKAFMISNEIKITVNSQGQHIWTIGGVNYLLTVAGGTPPEPEVDKKMYYGTGDSLPTSLGSNYKTLSTGNNEQQIEVNDYVVWIAIPNELSVTVTEKDSMNFPVDFETDDTTISGYTIYYEESGIPIDERTFIVILN